MSSKNDISSFKNLDTKNIIESENNNKKTQSITIGRPPKAKKDRESYRIAFSFTQAEADIIIKKAGRLSPNIFLKNYIREETDLLTL